MERAFAAAKDGPTEPDLAHVKALALARSGQLQLAGALARRAIDLSQNPGERERGAVFQAAPAVWHALVGNVAEARRAAAMALDLSTGRDVSYAAAFALALTGELSRSQALLKDLEARFPQDTTVNISYLPALRGLIALSQGKPAEALKQLEPALVERIRAAWHGLRRQLREPLPGVRARPDVSWPHGDRRKRQANFKRSSAIAVSSCKIPSTRSRACNWPERSPPAVTPRAPVLAYQDFLTLWKQADADVPLLKQAQAEAAKLRSMTKVPPSLKIAPPVTDAR